MLPWPLKIILSAMRYSRYPKVDLPPSSLVFPAAYCRFARVSQDCFFCALLQVCLAYHLAVSVYAPFRLFFVSWLNLRFFSLMRLCPPTLSYPVACPSKWPSLWSGYLDLSRHAVKSVLYSLLIPVIMILFFFRNESGDFPHSSVLDLTSSFLLLFFSPIDRSLCPAPDFRVCFRPLAPHTLIVFSSGSFAPYLFFLFVPGISLIMVRFSGSLLILPWSLLPSRPVPPIGQGYSLYRFPQAIFFRPPAFFILEVISCVVVAFSPPSHTFFSLPILFFSGIINSFPFTKTLIMPCPDAHLNLLET